ncbi:McrB family protein [Campylobacter ureolyticus]|uniref:Type II restriction endonuclease n=1 Tax=Campylobacter ureolyticus TaxID=827 RepID=A0AAE7JPJ5_9BACT|nr:AAA family ATPase [Campylobacter ureolyticus]MCR8684815.1 AAA family ATPase [Campylobacter ureolyticus]QKF84477.1 type II restriction endonuclease [Campylobacter ureolyticus]QQY35364.1 AAA family ATPase [Campylobacter ureolyticus]SUX22569.1 polysulfide reductase chain C (sulfur reductase chain C) [Campylobacter ureolyticus]
MDIKNSEVDLESEYRKFLKKNGITSYVNYLRQIKPYNLGEISDEFKNINLYEISDPEDYKKIKDKITSSSKYKDITKKSKKAMNASLNWYEKFLKERESQSSTQNSDKSNKNDTHRKHIDKPHQRIFFGAPGTGKSYLLNEEAKECFKKECCERVTFHPNYMYGNFVGAFKPFPKKIGKQESITYEYIPGVLLRQLTKALQNQDKNYLLIIEEINRANVAAVFGDIFQLLDRDESGDSEYSIAASIELQEFLKKNLTNSKLTSNIREKMGDDFSRVFLPSNLYIWATMNSADQGVMPIDTAFKRRWEFRYIGIDDAVDKSFEKYKFQINSSEVVKWDDFRKEVNKRLSKLNIPEDKLIGPYFISKSILQNYKPSKLTEVVKDKFLMYLYEDAARAYRSLLFAENSYSTYSNLCKEFQKDALNLFKYKLELKTEKIEETKE